MPLISQLQFAFLKHLGNNRKLRYLDGLSAIMDPAGAFNYLLSVRDVVHPGMYNRYLRDIFKTDTNGVPLDLLLEAFRDTHYMDFMTKEEINEWNVFPDKITIFRGTQDFQETRPRLSWTLDEEIARKHSRGVLLFKASIDKHDIYAYCKHESEIIAYVPDGMYDDIF